MKIGRNLKRAEVRERLWDEQGLLVSESSIQSAAELYAALVELANLEDPELIAELKKNRVVVLSADAAKPIRGDDSVWFVRDVISGRTLAAEALSSSRTVDLKEWLKPVKGFLKRHGLPIGGIVIDAEANIQAAMEETFPAAPIQLCQFHYVSNLAKPLVEHDRDLRRQLQEGMNGVPQLAREVSAREGRAQGLSAEQSSILGELLRGLRSVLKDNGKSPYKPGGLRMYDRLLEAEKAVKAMRRRYKQAVLLDLQKLLGVVRRLRHQAEWLREFYQAVWAMSDTLFSDNATGTGVRGKVQELKGAWDDRLGRFGRLNPEHPAVQVLERWETTTDNYGDRLFTTYSHPHLPRTNNAMEQAISSLKQLTRAVSGSPNPAVRFKRQGATYAYFLNRKTSPGEKFIASRKKRDFDLARRLLAARRRERSIEHRARRDFSSLLDQLQKDFDACDPPQ